MLKEYRLCSPHLARARQRHDDLAVVVPYHPPEVLYGVGQRVLGNDELAALLVTLQEQNPGLISTTEISL